VGHAQDFSVRLRLRGQLVRQGQGGENRPARLDAPLSLALCLAGENACPPPYADIGQHGRLKKSQVK